MELLRSEKRTRIYDNYKNWHVLYTMYPFPFKQVSSLPLWGLPVSVNPLCFTF